MQKIKVAEFVTRLEFGGVEAMILNYISHFSNKEIFDFHIVTQDINPTHGIGQIKVSGETWSAKTTDNSVIEKGTQIKIIKIDGVKAIVEPIKKESTIK